MALRTIINYPNPKLREVCPEVKEVNKEIKTLLADMAETMYDAPGIGLAAPQIGVLLRAIVLDVSGSSSEHQSEENKNSSLLKLVNPKITKSAGQISGDEGCLSIPGVQESVERFSEITVEALDENGKDIKIEADGMLSICLQHEIDHLDGVLFIDKIGPVSKQMIKAKLKKLTKAHKKSQ